MSNYWNVGSTLGYWYSYNFSVERGGCDLFVLLRDLLDRRGRQLHGHPHRPHQQENAGDYHHDHGQGGRTWQPFVGGKNGQENFRKPRIYNFRDKCVIFELNRNFSNLTQ